MLCKMGNEKKCNGNLSAHEFYIAARAFCERWKNAHTSYPNWTWIPCKRLPTNAENNEGYLSLENVYYIKPNEDLVSSKMSEEEGPADIATLVQIPCSETHVYDFHIAYSFSYRAPVLYFRGRNFDGLSLDLDDIHQNLPEYSLKLIRESKWTFMTLEEHPYLQRPWCMLHPCGTSDWMKLLLGGLPKEKQLPIDYLLSWLSVVGQLVGLRIPIGLSSSSSKDEFSAS